MPEPDVLWPAPGLPALVPPTGGMLELLVAHDEREARDLARWAAGLSLCDDERLALGTPQVRALAARALPRRVRAAAALPRHRARRFAAIRLAIPPGAAPEPPRRARVFDLWRGKRRARARCVAVRAPRRGPLRLAFASDLHVGALWDEVATAVARHAPDLAPRLRNPNALVRRLVAQLEHLAARGELDAVVLGGDLVDHVYRFARTRAPHGTDDTNLPALLAALEGLGAPCFAIPGNHDHRLFPWRPRVYGLESVGVPPLRLRALLRAAGLWDAWWLRPSDGDALRTEESERPALAHHLAELAPATDYAVDLDELRLVFASTGRDLLPRWREVEPGRRRILLRSLRWSWASPDSEGLDRAQIGRLARRLDGARGAAVFLHAPLLSPPPHGRAEQWLPRLGAPGDPDDADFERGLAASGLRRGVFFRNPAAFAAALRGAPGDVAVFAGHVHRTHAVELDPRCGALRSRATPLVGLRDDRIPLLTAPAVGHASPAHAEPPGYLLARFEQARLTGLERRAFLDA